MKAYLRELGYLASEQGVDPLIEALREFQRVHRLNISGHLTPETVEAMKAPRCGVGDHSLLQTFADQLCRWNDKDVLRFAFENPSRQLTPESAFQAVRHAFRTWEESINVDFKEVALTEPHEIVVSWVPAAHDDFNMTGNVVAHAFFPPGCGADSRNPPLPVHFDDSEPWSVDGAAGGLDVESVGLHEIGHTLGLQHSGDPDSVMFYQAGVGRIRRALAAGDLAEAQSRYGGRATPAGGRGVAATRLGTGHAFALSVEPSGQLTVAHRTGHDDWLAIDPPLDLGPVSSTNPVIVMPDPGTPRLLLLATNPGGAMSSSVFVDGRWRATQQLTGDGWFAPHTSIAVSATDPLRRARIAWFNSQGSLSWLVLRDAASIDGPFTHPNQGLARPRVPVGLIGAPGAADQEIAVFASADGSLQGCMFNEAFASNPVPFTVPGRFPPWTSVAMTQHEVSDLVVAFAFDNQGALTLCRGGDDFSNWECLTISDPGMAAPGSPLSVTSLAPGRGIRLVFVAIDGSICNYVINEADAQLIGATDSGVARLRATPVWIDGGAGLAGSILFGAPDTTAWELPLQLDGTWGTPMRIPV